MGGTSVPMLLCQIAAIRAKSVGTEVPPARTKRSADPGWSRCRDRKKPGDAGLFRCATPSAALTCACPPADRSTAPARA
ncbi:DUF6053 domain-containing protein [Lysobacter enzymogenes]|uniref:DUF6053 domain-containing protein n=1 Tax=Lysobacter enzymogenes TaxID=69 RepID=UPI003D18BD73